MMEAERKFREGVDRARSEAKKLMSGRDDYNCVIPLPNMFPHGVQDVGYEVYKKASRILGLLARARSLPEGNPRKYLESARDHFLDIINYGALGVALIDGELREASQ